MLDQILNRILLQYRSSNQSATSGSKQYKFLILVGWVRHQKHSKPNHCKEDHWLEGQIVCFGVWLFNDSFKLSDMRFVLPAEGLEEEVYGTLRIGYLGLEFPYWESSISILVYMSIIQRPQGV